MSAEDRPPAVFFDPASAEIPPTLGSVLTTSEEPILLLVAAGTDEPSMHAAVALANLRALAGHPTVLADAAVTAPRLHELVGLDNVEGLADLFLFGASLDHVRRQPPGWPFDFVATGAFVPDPPAVLDSGRWAGITDELRARGEVMLLLVPAATPGLGALSRRVRRAVLIGDDAGAERAAARLDRSCRVLALVRPAAGEAAGVGEAGAAGPSGEPAADAADATDAMDAADAGGAEAVPSRRDLSEPLVFRSVGRRRRLVSPLLVIALIVAAAVGGWYLYRTYLLDRTPVASAAEAPAPEPPEPVERGDPIETPIPVSVAVEAHRDLESAWQRVATLRAAEPSISFFLAPVSVNGSLFYRLLAGPVEDREAGDALMQRLVDAEHKSAFDAWAVRPTELAFHFGEYDDRAAAAAREDSLAALGIPAYIVPVRHDPGEPRYRVYGGAFESRPDAAVMERMLDDAGIEATLVPRTGEPVDPGAGA